MFWRNSTFFSAPLPPQRPQTNEGSREDLASSAFTVLVAKSKPQLQRTASGSIVAWHLGHCLYTAALYSRSKAPESELSYLSPEASPYFFSLAWFASVGP